MKTTNKLIGLIALAIITFAFTACKDEPEPTPDLPREQSTAITPVEGLTLTVKGTFKNSEWGDYVNDKENSVAGKIEAAIKAEIERLPVPVQPSVAALYAKCEAIIVEQTTEYPNWKTNGDGKTIYINFDILDLSDVDLGGKIGQAIGSMNNSNSTMAKVIVPNPHYQTITKLEGEKQT